MKNLVSCALDQLLTVPTMLTFEGMKRFQKEGSYQFHCVSLCQFSITLFCGTVNCFTKNMQLGLQSFFSQELMVQISCLEFRVLSGWWLRAQVNTSPSFHHHLLWVGCMDNKKKSLVWAALREVICQHLHVNAPFWHFSIYLKYRAIDSLSGRRRTE